MTASRERKLNERPSPPARSKDGYLFNPSSDQWQLNKDWTISLVLPPHVDPATALGFRATLQRYAEELSAAHTRNMAYHFKRFLRETGASEVSTSDLINWRASLGPEEEWRLGGLKGFLLAWYDYGFKGVSREVAELLMGWRLKGNVKGAAVASGCPETGPYTDLEMSSLLDSATTCLAKQAITFTDFAYFLTLAYTARRPSQIAALRGRDLNQHLREGTQSHQVLFPRAKQRGGKFRSTFRALAVIEDLYLVLKEQHRQSISAIEERIGETLAPSLADEVPVFLRHSILKTVNDSEQLKALLLGPTPDHLHVRTNQLQRCLQRFGKASRARSERTGEYVRVSASRFRLTRGTNLRREGFGAFVIAELLDHTDIQNVRIYMQNTAQEAVVIDELVGSQLAPFAQACLGTLVHSEREAIRGDDPHSRIPNGQLNAVGTCGNYGFCASGYRACYTCYHFQPWVDGPHEEVLAELYSEKERTRVAGCAEAVVNANDQLILAVEHCVQLCRKARAQRSTLDQGKAERD